MTLLTVLVQVVTVVVILHILSLRMIVGLRSIDEMTEFARTARANLRTVAPTAVVLGVLLIANGIIRDVGVEISWLIGLNITALIHAFEGQFVARIQALATPGLTAYFSFIYIFGYVFLLTFPLLLYGLYDDSRPLDTMLVAYILNYGIGLGCYIVFVSYGPRNFMPEHVTSLLYTTWPQSQLLTSEVNVNTNVFPSLHTSLSATVALLAYRFREVSTRWLPVATVGAVSVALSTMYLGIHWLTDVLAGIVLAAACVALSIRMTTDGPETQAPQHPDADANGGRSWSLRR